MEKIALITGATGGIGLATAKRLGQSGYKLIINGIDGEAAKKAEAELHELGIHSEYYHFDVTNEEEVKAAFAEICNKYDHIDVLVNNAGITRDGLLMRMSKENWDAVINTNLTGAYNVSQPVVKVMMKQRSGAIVNMASIVGIYGNAGQANYAAAKTG